MIDADLNVLHMIATGTPLADILASLIREIEAQTDGMSGSILLVEGGVRVRHAAAPNLPAAYVAAIDGQAIGPNRGSCGTAAYTKEPVLVEDVESDPRWDDFREIARPFGFRACWSIPILAADRAVLGTFALYAKEPRRPTPNFVESFRNATNLAAVAIERHRYEQTLSASERRFKTIIDNSLDANVIMDARGHVARWSPRAAEIFGWAPEEAVGQRLSTLIIPPSARERHEHGLKEYLKTGRGPLLDRRIEVNALHKDGREIPVELTVTPLADSNEPLFSAFVRDLGERHRAEQALRESQEHLAHVYDRVADVVFQLDVEPGERYRFSSINAAFTEATGLKPSEVLGKFVEDVIPEPSLSFVRERYAEAIRTKSTLRWDETTAYPKGIRQGDVSITPVFDAEGRPKFIVGAVRDRTERNRLEEELRHLQKMEAIGRLSAGVAHDFNNILAVIMMTAEMLLEGTSPDDQPAMVREIVAGSERGAALTRQFLAFSRKQVMHWEPVDLGRIVIGLEGMLRRLIGERIELVNARGAQLYTVHADPTQLEQVVLNLVVNARDAMPAGGRIVIESANTTVDQELAARHPDVAPGEYVVLSVSDAGVGMSDQVRQHIFEPFFTTKEPGRGTGLGLSTVYGIAKQSGGFVDVTTRLGEGSTFRVYLPRATGPSLPVRPRAPRTPQAATFAHVLVVEDDEALRTTLARALRMLRCRTTIAATAEEALLRIEAQPDALPELLIADTVMPGKGSSWLAERLSERIPHLKVLRVSGYPDESQVGPQPAGTSFLQKPFSITALFKAIEDLRSSS